ncbi:MAG: efflux RND transporter permease subunit, partial [Bacteroidetes bacterium]
WALGHKTVTLVGTLLLILASFALPAMGLIGTEFADPGDKGEFVLKVELPKDATIQNTNEAMQILETDLGNRPEVKKLYANIGTSSSAFGSLEGQNLGDIFVTLLPPQESGLETSLYARSLQLELQQKYPEYKIETGLLGLLGGADQLPIQIILSGADKDSLYLFADQVKAMISKIDGVVDADISVEQGNPEIDIRMNRERMSDLGLSLDIVGASLQAAFNGTEATKYRDGDNEYDVTVRLDQFNRRDISDIENLSFINNQGQAILLSQFAEISRAVGPTQLDRRNRIAAVTIGSNVLGRTSGSVGEDIKQAFTKMHIPAGVEISYDGDIKNQAEGFGSLGLALIASFILVYLIMVALYDSYVYPFVVIFSIPVALIGALLALALSMKSLSIFSILGFIMLLGLVSKNAILIVDFTNQLKREGKRTVEALVIAGKTRLRPILMTTIAMVIGMMPIALADGPASVWKNGLAWALIGGLTSSMLLTLLVVPAVYMSVDILGAIFSGDKEGRPRKHELDSIDIESIGLIELDEALGNGHARTEEAKAEGAVV